MPENTLPPTLTGDPAELVAQVLDAKRELLLRSYYAWLPREDLEDCLAQAALELLQRARRPDASFAGPRHVKNALEQKFRSRIYDRLRSRAGRSQIETALAHAASLEDASAVADLRPSTEEVALTSLELSRIVQLSVSLSHDQRLALVNDVFTGTSVGEFCRHHGWSEAKYRKVLQRARHRLRRAMQAGALGHG